MRKLLLSLSVVSLLAYGACSKDDNNDNNNTDDFKTLEQTVITDFADNVALSGYSQLKDAATNLNTSIQALNTTTNDVNLQGARTAWKAMRNTWEQCEGFLFGPVEDNDYDPNMDTWPTDYVQMDSLLVSSNALEVADIQNLTLSLRGYHPIEYIIFGDHGSRTAAELTARQKKYMVSLTTDLAATCTALYQSWSAAPENFAQQVKTAGTGSTKYSTKKEVFLAMAGGLIDICEEVGEGKMKEPYDAQDPAIVESPYSGNSTTDFKNNIVGIQNVYLGLNGGKGLSALVAAKNKSLDNKLQSQITAAINSFNNITVNYEQAIISQRVQVQQTMTALATLKTTLEDELVPFIQTYITD